MLKTFLQSFSKCSELEEEKLAVIELLKFVWVPFILAVFPEGIKH